MFQKNKNELHQRKGGKEIPANFEAFVYSDLCYEFCEAILDYCKYLLKLEKKKQELEEDARKRRIPPPKILKSETDKLNAKAKRMGDMYGRLIFQYRSIGDVDPKVMSRVAF